MTHTELQPFVDAAKERGAGDEFLASMLTRRGWPARDVDNALAEWWERATGVALPARRGSAGNARDAFLYLLAFSTLTTWACALGSLWFQLIERWLPDAVVGPYAYNFRATVTWQMASILVALPVYLLVMRMILRETVGNPDRIESGVRKWLTYIALLLAAIGVVSDLVCFTNYFLKGEITLRFVLKCVTVLAICGSIFWYYLGFLRGRVRSGVFAALAVALAATAFGFGLAATGTPGAQRRIEADNRRLQDLRTIAGALNGMTPLPRSLAEARAARPGLRVTDPETARPYEYIMNAANEYELCATFAAADEAGAQPYASGFWRHPKGRACFGFTTGRPVPW
jgi:Domain of unknown function (DUF5671)